jgi:hypothetical protein
MAEKRRNRKSSSQMFLVVAARVFIIIGSPQMCEKVPFLQIPTVSLNSI